MDKTYADTVRLLLSIAPEVFANDIFAMKGGTVVSVSDSSYPSSLGKNVCAEKLIAV